MAPKNFRGKPGIYRNETDLVLVTRGICPMAEIIFHCPNVDLRVRQLPDGDARQNREEIYDSVLCHACTRLHFINKKTGKLLGLTAQPGVGSGRQC
jgi:hypothetical protein